MPTDTERLTFLGWKMADVAYMRDGGWEVSVYEADSSVDHQYSGATLREAIDQAIEGEASRA